MLIITRTPGDCLRIDDEIQITVTDIDRGDVYLRINAPKHIKVERGKPLQRIEDQTKKGPE